MHAANTKKTWKSRERLNKIQTNSTATWLNKNMTWIGCLNMLWMELYDYVGFFL